MNRETKITTGNITTVISDTDNASEISVSQEWPASTETVILNDDEIDAIIEHRYHGHAVIVNINTFILDRAAAHAANKDRDLNEVIELALTLFMNIQDMARVNLTQSLKLNSQNPPEAA